MNDTDKETGLLVEVKSYNKKKIRRKQEEKKHYNEVFLKAWEIKGRLNKRYLHSAN